MQGNHAFYKHHAPSLEPNHWSIQLGLGIFFLKDKKICNSTESCIVHKNAFSQHVSLKYNI